MPTFIRCLLLPALVLLGACSVNPVTGERELSLVSTQQEIAMGQQQYVPSQQSQGGQYLIDPDLQAYVADIGHRLAAVSHSPQLPYEFVVLNNGVPNAWALPGGKIAVNRGLLTELESEAELAAVLGHEIVHAAARHGASQMSRGTLTSITAQLATIAASRAGFGELGQLASQAGSAAFMARYGREDELESDKYGMEYMAALGYDPAAAVSLQETFVRLSGNQRQDFISGLFASHPPSQDRVQANRERAGTLPAGERFAQRYQQHIKQLKKDAPAYEKQAQALAALKEEKPRQALDLLDAAIAIQPAEANFWEARGHAWAMLENTGNAEKAYSTAIRKNPHYFSPKLYRGLIRFELDKPELARKDLLASHQLLPNAVSAYYIGETYLQQGDEAQALAYYSQAASSGAGAIPQQAKNRITVLELPSAPDKYIANQVYVGGNGYLLVAVKNTTALTVGGITLQLLEQQNSGAGGSAGKSKKLRGSYQLAPGERIDIATGIGPLQSSAQAQLYRSRVVTARIVDK